MISDAVAIIELFTKAKHKIEGWITISALFDSDGNRLEGSDKIEVEKIPDGADAWYYRVKPVKDYVFVRMPVNAGSVIEESKSIGANADATTFRYIPVPNGNFQGTNRIRNSKVDFFVIGYTRRQMLDLVEGKI
ncbi:hypothetical protein COT47_02150 [Candidatus Woesearchaeota archaeon CG08_land_8_20_14_0_20_43_7]|nr:MAG: hypothetical protein COT47_02150 [Candidatus Woesearchaeota archaeon CG08_land_8_20_14_0_20_43_7]